MCILQLHVINVIIIHKDWRSEVFVLQPVVFYSTVQHKRRKYCSAAVGHDTAKTVDKATSELGYNCVHIFYSALVKCCLISPFLQIFQEEHTHTLCSIWLLSGKLNYYWNTTLGKALSYCRCVYVPSLSAGDYCCCSRSSPGRTERRSLHLCTPGGLPTSSPLGVALEVGAGLNRKQ